MAGKNWGSLKRFLYAGKGLLGAWQREASIRIQCLCTLALFIFCLIVQPSAVWCAIFVLAVVTVLGLELVNTALEALLDKFHPEIDREVGFAKDCLAGAVLVASLGAVLVLFFFLISHFDL